MKGETKNVKVLGVIPARYSSSRLPGKPLIKIGSKPMIQHVYESALKSKLINELVVATDDKRIFNAVKSFGGNAQMTSKHHKSGTDRIGEIVNWRNSEIVKCDIIVNIQGDEPFINPGNIDKAISPLLEDKNINFSTLAIKINNRKDTVDPNIVKVVFDADNFALYFSRNPIPYNRDKGKVTYFKHIGLYVYRKSYLKKLIRIKPTVLELAEKLEQLRILENGGKIKIVVTKTDSHSIDTKSDLAKFKKYG